jgi:hypothetical protein
MLGTHEVFTTHAIPIFIIDRPRSRKFFMIHLKSGLGMFDDHRADYVEARVTGSFGFHGAPAHDRPAPGQAESPHHDDHQRTTENRQHHYRSRRHKLEDR